MTIDTVSENDEARLAIRARNLTKRFANNTVVDDLSFDVEEGKCVGLLGPNGAGKTTTIKMILGHASLSGGDMQVLGLDVTQHAADIRKRCGVVPQLDNLDIDFTVIENLQVYGSFFGLSRTAIDERIPRLLKFARLEHRADQKVDSLSGGMQRRLSIARALVNDPELIVLDEPTTGLDPQIRHLIWERVGDLKEQGKTILLTTHYMEEAERLCDHILIIDEGKILAQGTPNELIAKNVPANVVEIRRFDDAAIEQLKLLNHGHIEVIGNTLYCTHDDVSPFVAKLAELGLAYISRPSNLEDVFLVITGRELRD